MSADNRRDCVIGVEVGEEGMRERVWEVQAMILNRSNVHPVHILLGKCPCAVCPPSSSEYPAALSRPVRVVSAMIVRVSVPRPRRPYRVSLHQWQWGVSSMLAGAKLKEIGWARRVVIVLVIGWGMMDVKGLVKIEARYLPFVSLEREGRECFCDGMIPFLVRTERRDSNVQDMLDILHRLQGPFWPARREQCFFA